MQKLLIIDTNSKYLKTMEKYLSWHNFNVTIETKSSEIMGLLNNGEYDLLICDRFCEPIDGYTLATNIRTHENERVKRSKMMIISEEEVSLERRIFLRKNKIYFMLKYKSTEKWIEKIMAILQKENLV